MTDVPTPTLIQAGKTSLTALFADFRDEDKEAQSLLSTTTGTEGVEISASIVCFGELLTRIEHSLDELAGHVGSYDDKTKDQRHAKAIWEKEVLAWKEELESGFSTLRKLKKLEVHATARVPTPNSEDHSATLSEITKILAYQAHSQGATQSLMEKMVNNRPQMSAPVKLPSLELPVFDGNILAFQEFSDLFTATIDSNKSLSPVQKLAYLRRYLTGKPLELVNGMKVCDANYTVAMDLLKSRYGNMQTIIEAHYTAIMDIPPCSPQTESLRSCINSLEVHLRSLEAAGETVSQNIFITIILSKLHRDVKLQLELSKGDDEWSLATLRKALDKLLRAKERADGPPKATKPHTETTSARPISTGHTLLAGSYTVKCVYCTEKHYSDECPKFKTLDERKAQLGSKCYICLRTGHGVKDCPNVRTCYHCKRNSHHRSICPQKFKASETPAQETPKQQSLSAMAVEFQPPEMHALVQSEVTGKVLMQTAVTTAANDDGSKSHNVRIFFDTGSSRTWVSEGVMKALGLEEEGRELISIATFGTTKKTVKEFPIVTLYLKQLNGELVPIKANVKETISCPLQKVPLSAGKHSTLEKVCLAEPLCVSPESMSIDILIGGDQYFRFVGTERLQYQNGLILIDSAFGFLAAGKVESNESNEHALLCSEALSMIAAEAGTPKEFDLERFWNLENIGIGEKELKTDDDTALESFRNSVRLVNGRYCVSWPWKEEEPSLPENRELAGGRLRALVKRLPSEVLSTYHDTIQEQLANGVIEVVDETQAPEGVVHYIPHHCVIKSTSESTKLRIVYDASAKANKESQSLNESLYRGPVMLPDLCGILLRFRMSPVAISSDVEKAFLQVGLNQPDRECTRFLWVKDPTKPASGENVVTFRFCRVPFGVIASPFLLSATIQHHLTETESAAAEEITRNIYVDNVLGSAEDTQAAQKYYEQQKKIFGEASMNLRQWTSNDQDFIDSLPEKDRAKGNHRSTKLLGMGWDTEDDVIWVPSPRAFSNIQTKRELLQCISSIFDPMGTISPITVEAKIIMQELWKKKFGWDEVLPDEIRDECQKLCDSLTSLDEIKIPRFVGTRSDDSTPKYELHVFTDASAQAYGAVAYLRTTCGEKVSVDMIFSKSRIAPTKPTSIPRLELFAAVLGTKMVKFLREQVPFEFSDTFIWSDSKCALAWITNDSRRPQFIARRIKTIHEVGDVRYGHVSGKENPADIVSRGTNTASLIQSDLWWEGPAWLKSKSYPECMYPATPSADSDMSEEMTKSSPEPVFVCSEQNEVLQYENYSSMSKLVRVNAWVQRFKRRLKHKTEEKSKHLTAEEIATSRIAIIQAHQAQLFPEEIKSIKQKKDNQLVKSLGLFIDSHGFIRCKGRMEYAQLPFDSKFPLLLAYGSHLARLIVMEHHISSKHAGVSQTLAEIRRTYWVPKGRSMVRQVVNKCRLCKRHHGKPFSTPPFAPLPEERLVPGKAFASVGIDYFGPLYVKTESGPKKSWVCLLTCLTTRAIHMELLYDMSTEHFLMGFRRFISRRGTPNNILSDNAKQFKLSKNVIDLLWLDSTQNDDVMEYVAGKGIKWKFITELAPWMGGIYERMIGIVKRGLRKAIGNGQLTFFQLDTVLIEIEAVVNSRPLVYVGEDFSIDNVLTPANFLTGHSSLGQPNFVITDDPDYITQPASNAQQLANLWKRQQKCLNLFWSQWSAEYLQSLRTTQGSTSASSQPIAPSVEDIVLLKDPDRPRSCWKVGKITKLHRSTDGEVRSASLVMPSKTVLKRPVSHLYPLECSSTTETPPAAAQPHRPEVEQAMPTARPRRDAAVAAALRNREIIANA